MENSKLVSEFLSLVDVENFDTDYYRNISDGKYFGMPLKSIIDSEKRLCLESEKCIAYFSMEYGLATSFYNKFSSNIPVDERNMSQEQEVFSNFRLADYFFALNLNNIIDLPIYSGGLGVLAGDTAKTMADYRLPVACVGMLWSAGYFRQKFWFKYGQAPEQMRWHLGSYPGLIPLKNRVKIYLKNEEVTLKLWKYYVYNYAHDYAIPLILLDSNIEPNSDRARRLTDQLYRSDNVWIKALQRIILGKGGVAALDGLGYNIDTFHLNEGHAVFAFIEKARGKTPEEVDDLRKHFVYTCHTPVQAGHDKFSYDNLSKVLKKEDLDIAYNFGKDSGGVVNLTLLAMNVSRVINTVSLNHQKVMHIQFPAYKENIKYVTNGVHPHTWISENYKQVFDNFTSAFGDVKANPMALEKALTLKDNQKFRADVWQAHQANKDVLCNFLDKWKLDQNIFTICWARRIAAYKRPSLILQDINRLLDIAKRIGPIQIIFAGKAHPADDLGFTYINQILDKVDGLTNVYDYLKVIMLENYEIYLAKMLTSGVDVWLNNPLPPFEASGTSGMKAILNGVIQISTFDGWVAEAADKEIGKIFGYRNEEGKIGDEYNLHIQDDAQKLYASLEEIVDLYYKTNLHGKVDLNSQWIDYMINCIACAGHFNTYRMLDEYKKIIWGRK